MTRDEAIDIVLIKYPAAYRMHYSPLEQRAIAAAQIDTCVALGILKLDEPKPRPTAQDVFIESLTDSHWTAGGIADRLRQLGMKVVKE